MRDEPSGYGRPSHRSGSCLTNSHLHRLLRHPYYIGVVRYPHYLKGSTFCGERGSRLVVSYAKGKGGTYPSSSAWGANRSAPPARCPPCTSSRWKLRWQPTTLLSSYLSQSWSRRAPVSKKNSPSCALKPTMRNGARSDGWSGLMGEQKKLLDATTRTPFRLSCARASRHGCAGQGGTRRALPDAARLRPTASRHQAS
jgi:hypothetical protein